MIPTRRRFSTHVQKRRRAEIARRRFMPLLLVTGLIAALAFGVGPLNAFIKPNAIITPGLRSACIWLGWLWLITFAASAFSLRIRSLWLLLEAPFALYFPLSFIAHGTCSLIGQCHGLPL